MTKSQLLALISRCKNKKILIVGDVILDEYHYGAWNENSKGILSSVDESVEKEDQEINKEEGFTDSQKIWDESIVNGGKLKLLLSGSSSLALEKGATESLAGRVEIINVYHWDYCESKQLSNISLQQYLKYGGYPKSYDFLQDNLNDKILPLLHLVYFQLLSY